MLLQGADSMLQEGSPSPLTCCPGPQDLLSCRTRGLDLNPDKHMALFLTEAPSKKPLSSPVRWNEG